MGTEEKEANKETKKATTNNRILESLQSLQEAEEETNRVVEETGCGRKFYLVCRH
jgi:hypothetical protein